MKIQLNNFSKTNSRDEIESNWRLGNRVDAVKTVISVISTLSSPSAGKFYPIQCFFVFDLLESFGRLVRQRINETKNQQITKIDLEKNWLLKISSIRDLCPRIYLHALLGIGLKRGLF